MRFRRDIQGLRAFAVVLVIINHAFAWPGGGFVGVDVFFVISGYLITGLLLHEHQATGSISFRDFYVRRLKRIAPAAIVVLALTVAAAYFIWYLPRANQVAVDATAALLFVENWHLIEVGANYLQATGPLSPVQHYWSLSVEEQFYALWPILLFAVLRFAPRRRRRAVVFGLVATAFLLSLAWSAFRTETAPSASYFDSIGRAWELLAGALIAALGAPAPSSGRARGALSLSGLGLIIVSAVAISPTGPFPFPWGVLPVAGAVLVITANPAAGNPLATPLTNPVAQYIGKTSFSLYLWHFPVIIFAEAIFGRGPVTTFGALVATALVSAASYRWIERPAIKSRFFSSRVTGRPHRRGLLLPITVAFVLLAMVAVQIKGPAWVKDASALSAGKSVSLTASRDAPSRAELRRLVAHAATAGQWPHDLTPSLNDLDFHQQAPAMQLVAPGCRNDVSDRTPLVCHYGPSSASRTVMVVGDSIAMSWVPAVTAAHSGESWQTVAIGYASCPLIDSNAPAVRGDTDFEKNCELSRQQMWQQIRQTKPDRLVLSASEGYLGLMADGAVGRAAGNEWKRDVSRTLAKARMIVPDVVLIGNPPDGPDPKACTSRTSGPSECAGHPSHLYQLKTTAERAAVADSGGTYVDAGELLCFNDTCPAFIGSTAVRTDATHITAAAATLVSRALQAELPRI
jgi:peptidoglycan/LPS O-acetylase OafA/YrhL